MYGKELILDIHNCNPENFDREHISNFCIRLCDAIKMERGPIHFWDYTDEPEEYKKAPSHLKGTSAIQFISTSNITIHTLDEVKRVYLNVFSCKPFSSSLVKKYVLNWFDGEIVNAVAITRV